MRKKSLRGRGRPKKADDEKLVVQIHVDLSLADAASLRRICEAKSVTKSEYFRECIKNTTYDLDQDEAYYDNMYDYWESYDEENDEEDE